MQIDKFTIGMMIVNGRSVPLLKSQWEKLLCLIVSNKSLVYFTLRATRTSIVLPTKIESPASLFIQPIIDSPDNQVTTFEAAGCSSVLEFVGNESVHCAIDPDQRPPFLNNQPLKNPSKVLVASEFPVVFAPASRTTRWLRSNLNFTSLVSPPHARVVALFQPEKL